MSDRPRLLALPPQSSLNPMSLLAMSLAPDPSSLNGAASAFPALLRAQEERNCVRNFVVETAVRVLAIYRIVS